MVEVTYVYKDRVTKEIKKCDLQQYQAMGWKEVAKNDRNTYQPNAQRIEKII